MPELVREVKLRGHEIACKGHIHHNLRGLTPDEFRSDVSTGAQQCPRRRPGPRCVGFGLAEAA